MPQIKREPINNFFKYVDVQEDSECLNWIGSKSKFGYGRFTQRVFNGEGGTVSHAAHRFIYKHAVGEIPNGLQLHHTCGNRLCVNPSHLIPVTAKENLYASLTPPSINASKTHCINGHPYAGDNLFYVSSDGYERRQCRICSRAKCRAYYHRMRSRHSSGQ